MYKYSHKVDSVHPDIVLPLGDTLHQSSNQLLQSQLWKRCIQKNIIYFLGFSYPDDWACIKIVLCKILCCDWLNIWLTPLKTEEKYYVKPQICLKWHDRQTSNCLFWHANLNRKWEDRSHRVLWWAAQRICLWKGSCPECWICVNPAYGKNSVGDLGCQPSLWKCDVSLIDIFRYQSIAAKNLHVKLYMLPYLECWCGLFSLLNFFGFSLTQ